MDRLIYTAPDGRLKVVIPDAKFVEKHEDAMERLKEKIRAKENDPLSDMEQVPESAISPDRTFRNAWKKKTGGIDIDLSKARDIAKDIIRQERPPVLERLDAEYFKAHEIGDALKLEEVVNNKVKARDATEDTRIRDAKTPDDLKSVMNTIVEEIKAL